MKRYLMTPGLYLENPSNEEAPGDPWSLPADPSNANKDDDAATSNPSRANKCSESRGYVFL